MQNCTLFLPTTDFAAIVESFQNAYGKEFTIAIVGDKAHWESLKISKKTGFFSKTSILITHRSFEKPAEFVPMMQGMMNFVGQIAAEKPIVQHKLMTKIQGIKMSLGIVAEGFLDDFETGFFNVLRDFDGFAFVDGNEWRDADKKMIMNRTGQSEVDDLNVPDTHVQLGQSDAVATLHESQKARKARNIAFLQQNGVPTIEHLPCIIADEEVQIRSKEEALERAIAIVIAALKGEGLEDEIIQKVVNQYDAHIFFSPDELAFINTPAQNITQEQRVKFTWRYECYWTLLWALGLIEDIGLPSAICDVPQAVGFLQQGGNYNNLLSQVKMRSAAEILDAADLIYRVNWACVNARVRNQAPPANIDAGVAYERHYTLNWLIRYQDQDWDSVRTDT